MIRHLNQTITDLNTGDAMSKVTISVFNTSDPDSIEAMDCLSIVINSPEDVASGITDRSGRFQADLPPGKYFFNIIDYALSPTTEKGIVYLLDYPIVVKANQDLVIKAEIDSSSVQTESDIPELLKILITAVNEA
jgi:hypothetical protein